MRLSGLSKKLSNTIVRFRVGRRIRARCASYWRLVHKHNIIDVFHAGYIIVTTHVFLPFIKLLGEPGIDDIVHERAFT